MNILLNGALGRMGLEVMRLSRSGFRGASIKFGVDSNYREPNSKNIIDSGVFDGIVILGSLYEIKDSSEIDVIVDFSHHTSTAELASFAKDRGIPAVISTTGHTEGELSSIYNLSESVPVFFSANMSLGVALLVELAKTTALAMPGAEIEIIEKHHKRKIDAPSGTALMIADAIRDVRPEAYVNASRSGSGERRREEIGVHAVRIGSLIGEHEVIVGSEHQTITLKHEAHSRTIFAEGALVAAEFIIGKESGLYGMKSLVSGDRCQQKR